MRKIMQHCLRALRRRKCLIYKEELTSTVEAASQAGFISTDGQFGTGRSSRSTGYAGTVINTISLEESITSTNQQPQQAPT
ncbi:hypothetical protein K469DRAFT_305218 [Zopfia rhizophila CBS 207.26]|uniref:Uncharacterized protein n=1 Tax=Zopfia rhizophila CBS 207.26 TaxID=1314779 RepID=A0A6A6D7B9_9PEZI|nr:hypothetical protein K469DRAFT_305218 [Zopfia rhizophila CBS 207.26]